MIDLKLGDCIELMRDIPENSVDSVVTDPPYHLTSIVKRFGSATATPCQHGTDGAFARASRGFMGKEWDGGDIAFRAELWVEVLRVLKPGGHVVAFSGSRTYHRMACAIEDAGFEIRDQIMWVYGSGFPKSHDISKALDKAVGAEREKIRFGASEIRNPKSIGNGHGVDGGDRPWMQKALENGYYEKDCNIPVSPQAKQWQGWGTALKPAHEPMVLARKPLIGTVAENVLEHGTGAINIDGCRIGDESRFPANFIHAGIDEPWAKFFYCPKASKSDRGEGNTHPTVKPHELMRYLCRLVTPPGGTVLDPFMGSGSTGKAAQAESFKFIGCEKELEYFAIAYSRLFV